MMCVGVSLCICRSVWREGGKDTFHDPCEGKDFMFGKAVPGNANPLKKAINEGLQIHSQFGEDSLLPD